MPRFLLISLLTVLLLTSRCSCCDENYVFCTVADTVKILNVNNAGPEPNELDVDTIPAKAFALRASIHEKSVTCQNFFFGMSSTAFALSCAETWVSRDTLDSLRIVCTRQFDAAHPALTSLNDCFVREGGGGLSADLGVMGNYGRIFYLIKEPDSTLTTQFIISLYFRDKTLNDTGQTVTLTR